MRTIEWYTEDAKALKALGLDVDRWLQRLQAAVDAVVAADHRQEALKAELKATTATVEASDREAYVLVSGAIDAAVGAYGKDSEKGRTLARVRSQMHRGASGGGAGAEVQPVERPSG